ncbi:MAG: enolase C-terminal domain-like protein [Burkholderiales bacterium]
MTKIVRVEIGRLDYPLVGDFKFFQGGVRPSVLVRLTDDGGHTGWGQAVPVETWTYETVESVQSTLERYLAKAVLGADPTDLADVHARMERAIRPSFSVGQPLAKAAIDLACFDLWGKRTGRSVSDLLGGARTSEVVMSWTLQSPTLSVVETALAAGRAQGYKSFNVKLGYPQTPAYDRELIRLVRALAPTDFLWADANTAYDIDTALVIAPVLAEAGFAALESPLPPARIRDYQRLKRQGAVPILMDEGIVSAVETAEFIALGMLDGIAMKVARCGGLWHSMAITRELEQNGLAFFASGLTDPELSFAASLHLFAAAGLMRPAALNGPQFIADRGMSDPACRAVGAMARVPTGPGLGVAVDARALAALSVSIQA